MAEDWIEKLKAAVGEGNILVYAAPDGKQYKLDIESAWFDPNERAIVYRKMEEYNPD